MSKGRTDSAPTRSTIPDPDARRISEPITLATVLRAGGGARRCDSSREHARGRGPAIGLWAAGFLSLSAGAFLGGTWHGFSPRLPDAIGDVLWKGTLACAGATSFFLLAGAAFASLEPRKARWLVGIGALKLAAFLFWAATHDGFEGVIADSGLAMIGILAREAAAGCRRKNPPRSGACRDSSLGGGAAIEALGAHDPSHPRRPLPPRPKGSLYLLYRGGRRFDKVDCEDALRRRSGGDEPAHQVR